MNINTSMNQHINSTDSFISAANEIHNFKFTYEKSKFVNHSTKITITCADHGDWDVLPGNHIYKKSGCKQCSIDIRAETRSGRITTVEFVSRAKKRHGDVYDYSKVEYTTPWQKVTIICKNHGEFKSNYLHLQGIGCPTCGPIKASITKIKNGNAIAPETRSKYELYESLVNKFTEQSYRLKRDVLNPENHRRTMKGWHLDHIYSKQQGFIEGIPAEVIGHWVNLQLLPAEENRRKYMDCQISKDELLASYQEAIR